MYFRVGPQTMSQPDLYTYNVGKLTLFIDNGVVLSIFISRKA